MACSLAVSGWWAPASSAAPRVPATGTAAPHLLPTGTASASTAAQATWIVGARPTRAAHAVARRHGARLLSERGIFAVPRGEARSLVKALRRVRAYRFAEPNRTVRPAQTPPAAAVDDFAATDWRGYLIAPTLVPPALDRAPLSAIIDAAVDVTHPDVTGVRVGGDTNVSDMHGTAVASLIMGHANGTGMVGVYPGAPLLAVGTALDAASITRAIATAVDAGARVINLSLGGPNPSYAMYVELAYAVSRGVLPVAAAGNGYEDVLADGTQNPVEFPAAFPHVLSVASIGPNGASSAFSSANGAVDVSAPGEGVLAAVPAALDDDGVPDGYQRLDGTSFAAPIVAGAAAWLMAARPNLDGKQVADVLRWSATDVDKAGWDINTGYGVVNVAGALSQADPPRDSAEVNDDIEWVNGTRFTRPDPYLFRTVSRSVVGSLDTWKDPADVYRIQVPARSRVEVKLRTTRRSDPDLAVFQSSARTVYARRKLVGSSFLGPGRTDRVVIRNRGRRTVAYVAVYAPTTEADYFDAAYALTVRRVRR